jgi:hypothetical protein
MQKEVDSFLAKEIEFIPDKAFKKDMLRCVQADRCAVSAFILRGFP